MSTEMVVHDDGLAPAVIGSAFDLAEKVARTEFVPSALRGKPEAVMACILMGREIGVGPMQSLSKIHVVDGRPAMAAELMRARALEAGHELWYEEKSATRVTVAGRRRGSDQVSKVTWTMDDAKRAGIQGKNNWRKYPRQMLTARATAELCRDLFPDALGGISYAPEELEDLEFAGGDVGEVEVAAAKPSKSSARRTVRRESPKRSAPAAAGPPLPHELADESAQDDDVVDAEIVEDDDTEDLSKLTKAQLVLRCHSDGLETEGTKGELIARLQGGAADFSEPLEGADEDPSSGDAAPASGSADLPEGGETGSPGGARDEPQADPTPQGQGTPPQDPDDDRRRYDRDGAQKAFHARLRDLGLDYATQVKPWMLGQYGESLSEVSDDRLHRLLSAMEDRPDPFVASVEDHQAAAAAGDGEAPAAAANGAPETSGEVAPEPDPRGKESTSGAATPSLADRAMAHAEGRSDSLPVLQERIRRAWAVLAVHNEPVYQAGWERARKILDRDPSTRDWSGASELKLGALASDLERVAAECDTGGR